MIIFFTIRNNVGANLELTLASFLMTDLIIDLL